MGKPFANGMMHGRLSGVFSCSDLQLRQSANYVRNDTPPLRGRELRQSLFQQPLQFHALQRLVRVSGRFSASASMPSPASSE